VTSNIFLAPGTRDNIFMNNIVYVEGELKFIDQGEDNVFDHNIYFGRVPKLPFGDGAIFADPRLIDPGGTAPDAYLLQENSPAIGTGTVIQDVNEVDFWGDSVAPWLPVDRGADETHFVKALVAIDSSAEEGGRIYPAGHVQVPEHTDLPFVIVPNQGHVIEEVIVDAVSVGTDSVYSFSDLGSSHTIHARFFAPQGSVTDPQDNLDAVTAYANIKTQTNNPHNFDGDAGRSVRINTDPGYLTYKFKEIDQFAVSFWGYRNDDSRFRTYASENGLDYTELDLTALSHTVFGNRYRTVYTSSEGLPEGIDYLKFEMLGGDAAWKAQIGSVSISWSGDE